MGQNFGEAGDEGADFVADAAVVVEGFGFGFRGFGEFGGIVETGVD
jgi:hypothetical protein